MLDLIQELYGTVMRNKLRTALTGFAVAWGIFMLIVLLGAGNGLIHAFEKQSSRMVMNSMKIYPGWTGKAYRGWKEGRKISLNDQDRQLAAQCLPQRIESSGASISREGTLLSYGKEWVSITLDGVFPNYTLLEAAQLERGRFINERDMRECWKDIVLHEKTADILFPHAEPIGKYLQAQGVAYQVVGIYSDMNSFLPSALVPFSTLRLIYQKGDSIDNITFTTRGVTDEADNEQLETDLRAFLGGQKQFDATDTNAIWIWNRFTQYLQQLTANSILHLAIWIIGIFTLLSGIVGVSNIMLITVKERTHEFGIRKAIGATPWSIMKLIITESVVITTFFGYVGMLLGIAANEYMNATIGQMKVNSGTFEATMFSNPTVGLDVCIAVTMVIVVAGTLAGLLPARKAALIKPIDALSARG